MSDPETARAIGEGAELTRRLLDLEIHHPPTLAQLARVLVHLRSLFVARDGLPDWRGQTMAYRRAVGAMYALAGASEYDTRQALQSALRYHVGIELRRTAPTEELEAKGLLRATPLDRTREHRRAVWTAAELWHEIQQKISSSQIVAGDGDIEERLKIIRRILVHLSPDAVEEAVADGDTDELVALISDIAEHVFTLVDIVERRRPGTLTLVGNVGARPDNTGQ